jgi:pyruvate/2-oxoglutarate dehydrogenase complex dihydrolipoamide dehydrogenase (E3) component
MDFDVLVIGAGPAGMAAATRAAELGARTAVVERARLGGTCVNSGCVPTRVLAKTARLYREVRTARDYGIVVHEPAVNHRGPRSGCQGLRRGHAAAGHHAAEG